MSSMYLYCAFVSSDEFSLLDTICIAMFFLCGSNMSTPDIVLDQRVPDWPSNAFDGPSEDVSTDDAAAGWFCERSVSVVALAVRVTAAAAAATTVATAARPMARPESPTVTPSAAVDVNGCLHSSLGKHRLRYRQIGNIAPICHSFRAIKRVLALPCRRWNRKDPTG